MARFGSVRKLLWGRRGVAARAGQPSGGRIHPGLPRASRLRPPGRPGKPTTRVTSAGRQSQRCRQSRLGFQAMDRPDEASAAAGPSPAAGRLSTNRGKGQEAGVPSRCLNPVPGLRFRTADGRLLRVPCDRSTCPYCMRRRAFVSAAMFGVDAAELLPSVAMTTTTRDVVTPADLREGQAQMVRRIRREVAPGARYCAIIEWTQGTTRWSGGLRRPHFHSLWKGLQPADSDSVRQIATEVWLRIAGADSHTCEEIRTPGGAVAYVARHHFKVSQSPPPGWSGKRLRPCKGWWELGAAETRARAETLVRDRGLIRRIEQELADRLSPTTLVDETTWDELVKTRLELRRRETVALVHVREVEEIDARTGELHRRAVEVGGELEQGAGAEQGPSATMAAFLAKRKRGLSEQLA